MQYRLYGGHMHFENNAELVEYLRWREREDIVDAPGGDPNGPPIVRMRLSLIGPPHPLGPVFITVGEE